MIMYVGMLYLVENVFDNIWGFVATGFLSLLAMDF